MKRLPPVGFTLLTSSRYGASSYSSKDLQALAIFVLGAELVAGPVELALDMTHPKRIRELNRHFRGVDRTTDVISFRNDSTPHPNPLPQGEREFKKNPLSPTWERVGVRGSFQGDIAINVRQAEIQARKIRHSLRRELRLLWIHGLLHLLGYTDYEPRPRRRMFKRQNALLIAWEKKHP